MKAFISFDERHDHRLAHALAAALLADGIEPVIASQRPAPGRPLDKKIVAMIQTADCVIVLATVYGVRNVWVQQELGIARASEKWIVPLKTRGTRLGGSLSNLVEWVPLSRKEPRYQFVRLAGQLVNEARELGLPLSATPNPQNDMGRITHLPRAVRCPACGVIEVHVWICLICGEWVCTECSASIPPSSRV